MRELKPNLKEIDLPYIHIRLSCDFEFILPYEQGREFLLSLSQVELFEARDWEEDYTDAFKPMIKGKIQYDYMSAEEYTDRQRAQKAGIPYRKYLAGKDEAF